MAATAPPTVLALVGENGNGILECQSRRFLDLLRPMGLEGRILRMSDPDFVPQLVGALAGDVLFAWSYAGVGARMAIGPRNLWDTKAIPFVSVLADAPYIMPVNHHVPAACVVNGYVYPEWLDFQERYLRSPQISALLPMGVIPNPHRHEIPWSARSTRMLFVKTGGDPEQLRARWAAWPVRLRTILEDCAAALATRPPGPIHPLVEDCLRANALVLDRRSPILFGLLHELDTYVRALRATAFARALLPLPADIVGAGWDHLRGEGGRARFHPPIPADALEARYADTQILVNTTPSFASGAHERVLRGFAARCAIVSDDNAYAAAHLRPLPTYHGLDWSASGLPDRLAGIFAGTRAREADLDAAEAFVAANHDPGRFLERMIELALLARMQPVMAGYALDAA